MRAMASRLFFLLLTLFTLATSASLDRRKESLQRDLSDPPFLSRRDANSFPIPFDTTIGDNFTAQSCTSFFSTLKQSPDITACKAISLVLQTSTSFFQAAKSPVRLSQTLDASCAVDPDHCDSVMNSYALALKSNSNCGQDLTAQNPLVMQAYAGLLAYRPVYRAACLKSTAQQQSGSSSTNTRRRSDVSTGQYCMQAAFTNRSSPTSSYVYYLPLGQQLPGGAMPACTDCLANTMQGFAAQAGNATQPLSRVYGDAVAQLDLFCGPTFVNATVPTVTGAAGLRAGGSLDAVQRTMLAMLAATVVWLVA